MRTRSLVAFGMAALLFAWSACASPPDGKRKGKSKPKKARATDVDRDFVPRGGFR